MKKNIKRILCTLLSVLLIFGMFSACSNDTAVSVAETTTEQTTQEVVEDNSATVTDINVGSTEPVTISDEVQEMAEDTKEAVASEQDIATDELAPVPDNEADIVDEGAIEPDAQVEDENISYDGSNGISGDILLGKCTGLTYYSQADSRWANLPYTSTNNKSQTMKSSACGPTCAAMIVSSSKGAVLPTTMAQFSIDNKCRTADNGTAWKYWSIIGDFFDFEHYEPTTSFATVEKRLETDNNNDGVSDYFVVASVGNGLFTTGGHYICLMGDKDNTLTVYDPYLYAGKFNTSSRRAANVTVSGNSAFVSETNFKKYANAKQYWIFSNDNKNTTASISNNKPATISVSYTRYVATQSKPLNVRSGPGTNYKVVRSLKKGSKVTVTATSGGWSKIGNNEWVNTSYLSATQVAATTSTVKYKTTVGNYYRLKSATTLYSKGNLTGTQYQYLAKTQIKVVSHYSATVDRIYVVKTGRYAYVSVSKFV